MNMIPIHLIDKPNYQVIQFKTIKNILMIENYCSDPDCHCNEVVLNFAQLNEDQRISNYLLNLKMDLSTGNILESTIVEPSIDADEIIFEFLSHFNQFKNHLNENNQKVKTHYSQYHGKELSPEILNLVKQNNCVDYKKVFGESNPITIEFLDETYLIEDQYCMKPTCLCNEVIMIVYKPNTFNSDFVIRLDLDNNNYEILKYHNSKDHVGLINYIAENKKSIFKTRYNRMKEVGQQFLSPKPQEKVKLTATQPKMVLTKVGRNELCPCGSGKKYKKCCGQVL